MDSPCPTDPNDTTAHHRAVLNRMIDQGAALATRIQEQAMAAPAAAPSAAAFDRVARCVRFCILLVQHLDAQGRQRIATRRQIIRTVEDTIQRHDDEDEHETLYAELVERLESPEFGDELDDRKAADIIADICRDLGLAAAPGTHPWKRRTPADIAVLRALAATTTPPPADQTPRPGKRTVQYQHAERSG